MTNLIVLIVQSSMLIVQVLLIWIIYTTHKDNLQKNLLDDKEKYLEELRKNLDKFYEDSGINGMNYDPYVSTYIPYVDRDTWESLKKLSEVDGGDKGKLNRVIREIKRSLDEHKKNIVKQKEEISNKTKKIKFKIIE